MKHIHPKTIQIKSITQLFRPFVLTSIVLLAGGMLWLNRQVDNLSVRQDNLVRTPAPKNTYTNKEGITSRITSGKGAFSLMIPDGWGPFIRPLNDDILLLLGTTQPQTRPGIRATTNDMPGYGGDSLAMFVALIEDAEAADVPRGAAENFTVGKADEAISGKKYTYIYTEDELVGIGDQRFQGDRDYTYILPRGNKQFRLSYCVYGSDPRNLSQTVDEVVRSVTFR